MIYFFNFYGRSPDFLKPDYLATEMSTLMKNFQICLLNIFYEKTENTHNHLLG